MNEPVQVLWTSLPAGTPGQTADNKEILDPAQGPGRLTALASIRLEVREGESATLEDPQFASVVRWPAYVQSLTFTFEALADDGNRRTVQLPSAVVGPQAGYLWGMVLPLFTPVRPIRSGGGSSNLAEVDGLDVLAPPSIPAWHSLRKLFTSSVRRRLINEDAGLNLLGEQSPTWSMRPETWKGFVENFQTILNFMDDPEGTFLRAGLNESLQGIERFHLRPPPLVHPWIDSEPPPPREDDSAACDRWLGDRVVLPALATTENNKLYPVSAPAEAPLHVLPCGSDRIGNGKGYRVPAGGRAVFQKLDDTRWAPVEAVVQVSDAQHRAEITLDPWRQTPYGSPQAISVVLPDTAGLDDGFEVTLRNLGEVAAVVQPGMVVPGREMRTFRHYQGQWSVEEPNEAENDVHGRLAALGSHPRLLRIFGLAIDFQIEPGMLPGRRGRLRLCVADSNGSPVGHRSAWTHYEVRGKRLRPAAGGKARSHRFPDGLLAPATIYGVERYELISLDVDAGAHQILRASAARRAADDPRAGADPIDLGGEMSASESERNLLNEQELPALRQLGVTLVDRFAAAEAAEAVRQAASLSTQLSASDCGLVAAEGSDGFYAEDLLRGFRVDVSRSGNWRPLCRRRVQYLDQKGQAALEPFIEEGLVAPAADVGRDPGKNEREVLRVSSALFRWDGWSLVVERPGLPLQNGGTGPRPEDDPPGPAQLGQLGLVFSVPDGDLEPLRFAGEYEFRLRAVDLAGNSLSPGEATWLSGNDDSDEEGALFGPVSFLRPEPVEPPLLVPKRAMSWIGDETQLAIRALGGCTQSASWWALPPRVSPAFYELHGRLDGLDGERAWQVLERYQGDVPKSPRDPFYQQIGDSPGAIPHLPDPLCTGLVLHCANGNPKIEVDFRDDAASQLPLAPWETRPVTIELQPGEADSIDRRKHRVVITLPPGVKREVRLGAAIPEYRWSTLALVNWAMDEDARVTPQSLRMAALAANLPEVTPFRVLTLVHAVPQALRPAEREAIEFVDAEGHSAASTDQRCKRIDLVTEPEEPCVLDAQRDAGEAAARLSGSLALHVPSAGKLDVQAVWEEMVDNPGLSEWVLERHEDHAFELAIPYPLSCLQVDERRKGGTGGTDFGTMPTEIDRCHSGADGCSFKAQHKLPDQKHHRITYTALVTSRYVDFYEDQPPSVKEKVSSAPSSVHVRASTPPAAPRPLYAVPTFAREEQRRRKVLQRRQRGGGLRIYLERGWFSSGEDEKLAVVLAREQLQEIPTWGEELITQWGQDPIWSSEALPHRPLLGRFRGFSSVVEKFTLRKPAVTGTLSPMDEHPCPPPDLPVNRREEMPVAIAAYDVRLDAAKNLLYADIEVDVEATASYFPFIRLALARYQPYALDGMHLSPIVLAHFIQLTPERTLTVKKTGWSRWEVVVAALADAGRTYDRRTVVEAVVERARYCGTGAGQVLWEPQEEPVVLERRVSETHGVVWVGEVHRACTVGDERLVVREWEVWGSKGRRLVYCEGIRI